MHMAYIDQYAGACCPSVGLIFHWYYTLEYCTNIAVYSIIRKVQGTNRKHGHSMLETAALDYPLYISRSKTYRIINALPGI